MASFEELFPKLFLLEVGEDYTTFNLERIESKDLNNGVVELTLFFRGYGSMDHFCLYLWDFLQSPETMSYNNEHFYCWVDRPYVDSYRQNEVVVNVDGYYRKILGSIE